MGSLALPLRPRPCVRALIVLATVGACGSTTRPPPPDIPTTTPEEEPAPTNGPYGAAQLAKIVQLGEVVIRPDASEIAFTSDRSGALEVWTISLDASGNPGAPRQRSHLNEEVSALSYAPDSSALVFSVDHGGDERPDLWILRRTAEDPELLAKTTAADRNARFSPDGRSVVFESDPQQPFLFNIHVMDLATKKIAALTHESVNVVSPRFSRDGRFVVATRTPDDQHGELLVVDVATKQQTVIAPPRRGGILYAQDFFPSGKLLALGLNDAGFMQLCTIDLATKRVSFVGPGDWDVEIARISDIGPVLYVRNVRGVSEVAVAMGPELKHERVLSADGVVAHADLDRLGRLAVAVSETPSRPLELVLAETASGRATTIVPAEHGQVRLARLSRATRREFKSFDGRSIDAFVTPPATTSLGKPPPAVVLVHGGPNGQTRGTFDPLGQALAEAGFLVIAPNYRGSTGYGRAFEDLNNRDWGGGDLKDIVSIVKTLATEAQLDRDRVGIMGGSYGGYMTLRAITAEPSLWRAAVSLYGMADLEEDYRQSEGRFRTWYQTEMGDPAKDRALFRERSPIHSLDQIRAPLLVMHGANDTNVPVAEAEAIVRALRERKHPVGYVLYANEGHGFTHRENRIDYMTRAVQFFVRELGQKR